MRILEIVVLSCIIIADWGLFLVPTIVYALPPLQVYDAWYVWLYSYFSVSSQVTLLIIHDILANSE